MIVAGATDAFTCVDQLKERKIPVLVAPRPLGKPRSEEERHSDPALAGRLAAEGVTILIGSGGEDQMATRDLPLLAQIAIGYGLDRGAAFEALTLGAARALDASDRIGSIEVGKDADILVLDGAPLATSTRVQYVLSAGEVVLTPED
jgi:imidazolonepropionase-like amidohydrolase